MTTLTSWRGGGVAAMLLGALLAALLSTEKSLPADAEAKAAALPPDLAKIPSDSMILYSVQVAELWNGAILKSVRGKHEIIDRAAEEFEKQFGLSFEQVERLSVAILGPIPANRHEPVWVMRTVKPYELAKVLAADAKLKPEKYKGKTLYVAGKWSIYPLDDRILVYSEVASELRNWIDRPRPKEKGALADALERAAEKHTLVFGLNIKAYTELEQFQKLPPELEPFRPLALAHGATLFADVGAEPRLTATFHFANEKDAKAAVKTAQSGLDLLRASLDRGIETLSKEKEMSALVSIFKQFQAPSKATQIERKGETLQASVRAKIDPAAAGVVLVQAVQQVLDNNNRTESSRNFHNLALAMHNYASAMQGKFPPHAVYSKDGKPLLSWRVLILPYMGQKALYNEFRLNEPWDSEHNKKLLAKMPKIFAHPRDEKTVKEHTTYYQGFVGKGTIFEGKQGIRIPYDIPDGTSNTIMIAEASKAVPWTKPEDILYDPDKPLPKLGLPGSSGFAAALCDGSVRLINPKISQRTLRLAITRNDGMPLGPDF
ncbi:MAG TPA: DUF1559 domain-containing protein [Gemmataceae bacterium]|nr:DUF1559 domain-containing protein [Gemmataceae bacterium]